MYISALIGSTHSLQDEEMIDTADRTMQRTANRAGSWCCSVGFMVGRWSGGWVGEWLAYVLPVRGLKRCTGRLRWGQGRVCRVGDAEEAVVRSGFARHGWDERIYGDLLHLRAPVASDKAVEQERQQVAGAYDMPVRPHEWVASVGRLDHPARCYASCWQVWHSRPEMKQPNPRSLFVGQDHC